MNTESEPSSASTPQMDMARIVFNAAVCIGLWFGSKAAGVQIFGDRWAGIDLCFRVPFYWCALNVASAAFWLDVRFMSRGKPDHTLFQSMFLVALYHVGGLVAVIIITLRQTGVIDVTVLQAVIITLGSSAAVVTYCSLGLFIAKLKAQDD